MTTLDDPEFVAFLIDKAIAEHRTGEGSRAEWVERFARDPEGTRARLAILKPLPEVSAAAAVPVPVLAKADRWGQPPSDANVVYSAVYPDCG